MSEGYHHGEDGGCGCGHGHQEGERSCGCGEHHGSCHHGSEHGGHRDCQHSGHCSCGCHQGGDCRCGGSGCGRCCGEHGRGFQRRFRTREERIAELEVYLRELEAEAQGVREAIAGLRASQPPSQGQPQG